MSILSDIKELLAPIGIPFETGVFTDKAPDEYIVVLPLDDEFGLHADNSPVIDIQEARISIYSKGNYNRIKNAVLQAFLKSGYTITARQYLGYESGSGYHHYNVDVANFYEMEDI